MSKFCLRLNSLGSKNLRSALTIKVLPKVTKKKQKTGDKDEEVMLGILATRPCVPKPTWPSPSKKRSSFIKKLDEVHDGGPPTKPVSLSPRRSSPLKRVRDGLRSGLSPDPFYARPPGGIATNTI